MTVVALIKPAITDFTVPGMAAFGTNEPIGPTPADQRLSALLLGAELRQKLRQAEALLKLNLILGHYGFLVAFMTQVQHTPRGWLRS